jgi:hypothetical protein
MCPDKELLSAYLDGEVPSPWKERIEEQIAADAECSRMLDELAMIRSALHGDVEPDFQASRIAVWQRIGETQPLDRPVPAWKRRLAVPFPVAAAAASLMLALAGALLWHTARASVGPAEIPVISQDTELVIRIGEISIDELLRIMNASESIGEVTVQLPENARFNYLGEAQMVRAADFRRGEQLLVPLTPKTPPSDTITPYE